MQAEKIIDVVSFISCVLVVAQVMVLFMSKAKTFRVGPLMSVVAAFVAAHPGCCKRDAARAARPGDTVVNKYGYAAVDRAIRAGLVRVADRRGAAYVLATGVRS
jgi:hypothetical protein